MINMSLQEKQLRLARNALANTIMFAEVNREGDTWTISGNRPARAHGDVVLVSTNGRREEPVTVSASTFVGALELALSAGIGPVIAAPKERLAELLGVDQMQPF
jgi:hypothetical protein